jgi:hypothetical protein
LTARARLRLGKSANLPAVVGDTLLQKKPLAGNWPRTHLSCLASAFVFAAMMLVGMVIYNNWAQIRRLPARRRVDADADT